MPLVFLLYLLFASVFTIAKYGLEYTEPFFLIGSRMMFAGVLMVAALYIYDKKSLKLTKPMVLPLILLSIFNIYLTNAFEFWGLQQIPSFKTCFLYSLSPFLSALLSYFIFSEVLSWKKWLGLAIGMLGFIPMLLPENPGSETFNELLTFSLPELSVVMAAGCSVYGWILLRQMTKDHALSPLLANGLSMIIGGGFALANSALVENWDPIPTTDMTAFLISAGALIVISNLLAYNLYGYLLRSYSATFMSFAGFTTPLFAALFGWFFLGETITWAFVLSATNVFAGLLLFYQEELREGVRSKVVALSE